jgi:DsbC/DsbD-like thiol-disulfide interchange protein
VTRTLFLLARPGVFIGAVILGCTLPPGATTAAGRQQPAAIDLGAVPSQARDRAETRHLTLRTSTGPVSSAPARRVTLFVDITPKPEMHVYAPEQKDVIPVGLTITPADGIRPGKISFPKPEKYFFAPLDETQFVYSKSFRIALDVTLTAAAAAAAAAAAGAGVAAAAGGPVTITGTLRYQACDEAICYVPQTVPVEWRVGGER